MSYETHFAHNRVRVAQGLQPTWAPSAWIRVSTVALIGVVTILVLLAVI